ncbi:uncharacterized protein LOC123226188 [Mangifera indica]|uniref:uncharacterized protein LOC123226188 n=1 Tax=Mangifera indica TaxID=29780 RepID=UPI001CF9BFC8|nr:uncharacterized protein LOC123226188 [Mangifera indica]
MVMVMAADTLRRNLIAMKERLLDKLKAAAVPADALENARQFLESVVSVAVHGLAKDALLRIKTHLVHPFSSLSPNITRKMVEEAEEEANEKGESEGDERGEVNEQSSSKALQLSRL